MEMDVNLRDVSDIFSVANDGVSQFARAIVGSLTPEETQRLLRLYYRSGDGAVRSFCFLESSSDARSCFMESMFVLCKRAIKKANQPKACLVVPPLIALLCRCRVKLVAAKACQGHVKIPFFCHV